MDQLPDVVLLEMLTFLDVKDLLVIRLVCKRLSALALHPSVWRLKSLLYAERVTCPVLRLAPCLDELQAFPGNQWCHHSLHRTRCAVRKLYVGVRSSHGAVHAALVIRHQESLGRLRKLVVRVLCPLFIADACVLLETLAATSGLEELQVDNIDSAEGFIPTLLHNQCSFLNSAGTSSIKDFHFSYFTVLESFCKFILTRHAATLEVVGDIPFNMTSVIPLLVELPMLREVSCSVLPGLQTLAACRALRALTLEAEEESAPAVQGATWLLRETDQLLDITLIHGAEEFTVDIVAELLVALASTGKSPVQKLCIQFFARNEDARPYLPPQALLETLPRLPYLRQLSIDWDSDELLRGITPDTAPALRSLFLEPERCLHAWMHDDTARALMAANPALHVRVTRNFCTSCSVCDQGLECHQDVRNPQQVYFWAYCFSHADGQCPSPEYHTADRSIIAPYVKSVAFH